MLDLKDQQKYGKTGVLLVDLVGTELTEQERQMLQDPRIAGLIFFTRNYECPRQMSALTREIREIRPDIVLTVDQEGGRVQRLTSGLSRLPSLTRLAEAGEEACEEIAWYMAQEVCALGIDLSFTPVLDIDYGHNHVIGDRAFGTDADAVIRCGKAFLAGMQRAGMPATGKHFPGHGWVSLDSHVAMPVDERSFDIIEQQDVRVFASLHQDLAAVMTAHVLYPSFDDSIATYSKKWMSWLRHDLGFEGLIISDDLVMAGATGFGSVVDRAKAAIDAGCDLLLVCNDPNAVDQLLAAGESWTRTGTLDGLRQKNREGFSFDDLVSDKEYLRIQQRWQGLLGQSM